MAYNRINLNITFVDLIEFLNNAEAIIEAIWSSAVRLDLFIKHNDGHAVSVDLTQYTKRQKDIILIKARGLYWEIIPPL